VTSIINEVITDAASARWGALSSSRGVIAVVVLIVLLGEWLVLHVLDDRRGTEQAGTQQTPALRLGLLAVWTAVMLVPFAVLVMLRVAQVSDG
jgi:hypothetical protein